MTYIIRDVKKGYTLVELMVAISIIALLFAAGVASYGKASQRSRDAKRKSDVEQLRSALEMYRADNSKYPPTSDVWQDISTPLNVLVPSFIPELPTDPQGFSYEYQAPADPATTYCITAFLEVTDDSGACIGDPSLPDCANYSYGAKNP